MKIRRPTKKEIAAQIAQMSDYTLVRQAQRLGGIQNGLFNNGMAAVWELFRAEITRRDLDYWKNYEGD